jgi:large subunit ribosomal protein L3
MGALIGRKVGTASLFREDGRMVPVTVLELGPCVVVQRKTRERDGYEAVQLGFSPQKASRATRPVRGHFERAGVAPHRVLREVRCRADETVEPGSTLDVSVFEGVDYVDVMGTSKGRGFQGVVRRHGMGGGPSTHGGGTHRRPGSIGMCEAPARVLKNKKMPGHMGHRRVTTLNLEVVQLRPEDNALLVRGAVAGPAGGLIVVRPALKKAALSS